MSNIRETAVYALKIVKTDGTLDRRDFADEESADEEFARLTADINGSRFAGVGLELIEEDGTVRPIRAIFSCNRKLSNLFVRVCVKSRRK